MEVRYESKKGIALFSFAFRLVYLLFNDQELVVPELSFKEIPKGIEEFSLSVSGPGMALLEETFSSGTESIIMEVPAGECNE